MTRKRIVRVMADAGLVGMFSGQALKDMLIKAKLEIDNEKLPRFEADVREAALFFFAEAAKATLNEVHHEIDALVRAALRAVKARKRPDFACERVAALIEQLSVQARKLMNKRGTLPDPETLRDPARQRDACETVARLGRLGAYRKQGRRRPGGKQSTTEVSVLNAPKLLQHPLRQEPHHAFLTGLEEAYLAAKGRWPPRTANPSTRWVLFVQACLDQLEPGVNAVELINEHHRRRRIKQLGHLALRFDKAVDALIVRLRLSGQNP
jgi:hypothetical protein